MSSYTLGYLLAEMMWRVLYMTIEGIFVLVNLVVKKT
jgi:hypothetical protein